MKKSAKNVTVFLVLVGLVAALGGCVPADCKSCRWWSYSDGYKYSINKQIIKPFAEKMEKEAEGKENVRVAVVQAAPTKEFSLQVAKAAGVELPELTDEAFVKIKEIIIEWLRDNGWTLKEPTETPFSLIVTLTSYREGSLSGRILRETTRLRCTVADNDRAEICGSIMLQNGAETILDLDLPRVKTAENACTEGKFTSVKMTYVQKVFAQVIVDTLNDYREDKITPNK